MNVNDIRLGYMNLRGILDGKWTVRYKSILDILISRFSGVNKCLQGHNMFVIEFNSSWYQIFVISLIRVSTEIPAYNIFVNIIYVQHKRPKLVNITLRCIEHFNQRVA